MRFDKLITAVTVTGESEYNPDTAAWTEATEKRVQRRANITPTSAERQKMIYGDVKADRVTVRLLRHEKGVQFFEIGGARYDLNTEKIPVLKAAYEVERVV